MKTKLSIGRTINIGNYESIRVDVGLEEDIEDYNEVLSQFKDMHCDLDKILTDIITREKATRR